MALAGLSPAPLLLALLLGSLLSVMFSGAHLAGAERLAPWFSPSPIAALSPAQVGKLVVFAGLAALTAGLLLLLLQRPVAAADRTLTTGFAWLLLPGGVVVVALDLAPALGFASPRVELAENLAKWAVFGGCGVLLSWRLGPGRSG